MWGDLGFRVSGFHKASIEGYYKGVWDLRVSALAMFSLESGLRKP